MDHKQPILHELLQQHQEPFHLKTYISRKRSHSHLHNSSPAESCAGFFLHVPSTTAAALAEAATRIQRQRQTQIKNVGVSLIGSFLKILKHRGARTRSRVERNCDLKRRENREEIRISSSCSRDDHFRASATTSFHDTAEFEARFGSSPISPFLFSPLKSPTSFSGRRTPDLGSPATSPFRRVKQEGVVNNGVEEEKEQCSPVCVLDAPYEDDEHQSLVGEEDDYHLHPSYANIERARQKLLERLERFEKLAELDQVDLEQKLLEASEEECDIKGVGFGKQSSSLKESRMKRVISEDKCKIVLWRDAIDTMMEVEFKTAAEVEETAAELEIAIFDELMEQCFCIDVNVTTEY